MAESMHAAGAAVATLPSMVHVPMAFSGEGNTLLSVVRQLGAAYDAIGGSSVAVLSQNRDVTTDPVASTAVDFTTRSPRTWYTRRELAVDVAAGAAGLLRPYYGRLYDPAIERVSALTPDAVLLYEGHYTSASLPRWERVRDRTQVCLYLHNPLSRSYGRRELRRLLSHADLLVYCADHLRADVEERAGGGLPRSLTVHNGFEPSYLVDTARTTRPQGEEAVVLFVGKMTAEKGVHLVLDAAEAAARRTRRPVRLRVIGSTVYGSSELSPYEQRLRAQAARLSIPVDFVRSATVPELQTEFAAATAVCLASTWAEGLPLVALEAMATSTPLVVSRAPGLVEACGEAALLADVGDAEGLGAGLASLLTDDLAWAQRAAASWRRAQDFSWTAAARRIAAAVRGESGD